MRCLFCPHESISVVMINEKDEIMMIQSKRYITSRREWEIPAVWFSHYSRLNLMFRKKTLYFCIPQRIKRFVGKKCRICRSGCQTADA